MEYNPFTQDYNRLHRDLDNKNNDLRTSLNELKWFDETDISSLLYKFENEGKTKNYYKSLIEDIEKEIEILNIDIQQAKKKTKTIFNPLNWFDESQKKQRKKLKGLKKVLNTKQEQKESTLKHLSNTEESIYIISSDIEKYNNFDRQKVRDEVDIINREIVSLKKEYEKVSDLKQNADFALAPVIKQIKDYESKISDARSKISKAQSFDRKLTDAENSYERAMIHQECHETIGDASPRKVIRYQERMIRTSERDLEKVKRRANQIGRNASRIINKIVIDGNNMCYEGDKFVGLDPLIQSSIELQEQYEVIIVFDSAIRSQVQANDKTIRSYFNNNIQIHVVANKQLADETILEIASNDDLCYILSNDRFGEYQEKEVIKNNRLIRHEIVDGNVFIHDLNINVRYD